MVQRNDRSGSHSDFPIRQTVNSLETNWMNLTSKEVMNQMESIIVSSKSGDPPGGGGQDSSDEPSNNQQESSIG